MTTLEIKRLDGGLANGSITSSPVNKPSIHLTSPSSNRQTFLPVLIQTSNINNNKKDTSHEIPISIIKSPSYNNQLQTSVDHQKSSSYSPSLTSNTTSTINNNNNKNNNNDNDMQDNKIDNDNSFLNESDNQANLSSNYESNIDTLRFNKYGFIQPNEVATNHANNINTPNKSSSSNNNNNNNNNNASDDDLATKLEAEIDVNSSIVNGGGASGGGDSQVIVTNLKDYLQNTDVEKFSENIPIKVIQSRELKWVEMLKNFDEWMSKRFIKIRSRCRKGIPQSMRSKAWMHLTGAFLLKSEKPTYYIDCLKNPNKLDIARYVEDIKKDLHRQFPSHEIFMKKEGRQMLFNVLKAYAVHNREVGYCQAQGPIAALLLMHMPEEDAFWMLIRISDYYLREYFKPGLEKVQIDGHALFYLFKKENPIAHKLMKQQSIDPILYMTEWFMCVFARTLPWCTVLRVWDMFFCEGVKVLYRVGLYLMLNAFADKQKFLKCQQQGMYETLNLLKNLPIECLSEHNLVKRSCLIKIGETDLSKAFEKSTVEFVKQKNELNANRKQAPSYLNPNKSSNSNNNKKKN